MRRFRPWTAVAALVLLVSGLLAIAPAGAAIGPLTVDCLGDTTQDIEIENADTVTWTVGSGCIDVEFSGNAVLGTLTVNGTSVTPNSSVLVSTGDTVVYNAPAMGTGYQRVRFSGQGSNGSTIFVSFPPAQGVFVDNGDGTVTVTYTGAVLMAALPQGSTCPTSSQLNNFYMVLNTIRGEESPVGATSPYTQGADPTRVPAGVYEGCLYYGYVGENAVQSGPIYIGVPAPTTTTTAGANPVTPAFAG
jgi:hypothetical protein